MYSSLVWFWFWPGLYGQFFLFPVLLPRNFSLGDMGEGYTSPLVLVLPLVFTNILRSAFNLISTTFPQKPLSFYPLKLGFYLTVKVLESLAYTCCFHCIIHSIMFCYLASALPNLLKWLSQRPANTSKLLNIMALLPSSFLLAILIPVFYRPEASDLCWPSSFLKLSSCLLKVFGSVSIKPLLLCLSYSSSYPNPLNTKCFPINCPWPSPFSL